MQVIASYLGGERFGVAVRDHRVICDQPIENGGEDEGMSPPEFLLAALATCAGYYAEQYLRARGLPALQLRVKVDAEKASRPARLSSFHIEIDGPDLDDKQRDGILRAVKSCLVHNTLLNAPSIEVTVAAPVPALAG